jgi:hypothetical protein
LAFSEQIIESKLTEQILIGHDTLDVYSRRIGHCLLPQPAQPAPGRGVGIEHVAVGVGHVGVAVAKDGAVCKGRAAAEKRQLEHIYVYYLVVMTNLRGKIDSSGGYFI